MPELFITCPTHQQAVSTGITMDKSDLDALADIDGREVGCPSCGQTHLWRKAAVFFG